MKTEASIAERKAELHKLIAAGEPELRRLALAGDFTGWSRLESGMAYWRNEISALVILEAVGAA